MKNDEFLSISQNWECARLISQQVLSKIAPEQLEVSMGLIEPVMEMYAHGKVGTVGGSDKDGGFGPTDLMIMVVVPIVVNVLSNVLTQLITQHKEKTQEIKSVKEINNVTIQQTVNVEKIVNVTIQQIMPEIKSSSSKKEISHMTKTTTEAVEEYFLDDNGKSNQR